MPGAKQLLEQRTRPFREAATLGPASEHAYKGLIEHARPGLHPHLLQVAQRYVPFGAGILDLAAGSGALSLRLKDAGYSVRAADYVAENFRPHDQVPFQRTDLDSDFAREFTDRFDAIVACEIVEHLENPRHFLRQCGSLMKRGGLLILTTPNPNSAPSKALFLRINDFAWFTDPYYRGHGHISPLTIPMLHRCAQECEMEVRDLHTFGSAWDHCKRSPRLRVLAACIALIDKTPSALRGDIVIAVLQAMH